MIKATELRCGNLVKFAEKLRIENYSAEGSGPFQTVYGTVESIMYMDDFFIPAPPREEIRLKTFIGPYKPDRLAGIPLTPEILEKFGFKKDDCYWRLGDVRIEWSDLTENFFWSEGIAFRDVLFLHQLQNLVFALTGKELEVKL